MMANMYFLREVRPREYEVTTDFTSPSLTFDGKPGIRQTGGVFSGQYTLAAGINDVKVEGTATVAVGGATSTQSAVTAIRVYGVDIALSTSGNIYTDKDGYSYNDFRIDYTINPSEYKPLSEAVVLYKDKEMIDYISSDIGSTGSATIGKGYQFDINSTYEAEVVLNYGSGVEIRNDKVKLSVTDRFVKLCKRDLLNVTNSIEKMFLEYLLQVKGELYHSFIWINGKTFGFSTLVSDAIFTERCGIEGRGQVEEDLAVDISAATSGSMHGRCQVMACNNPDKLLQNAEDQVSRTPYYYCLYYNPLFNHTGGMNCQEWANMMIATYCD
ncbi:MAG: hypothetical protein M1461_05000 [Nitrospirae bacterium]|nr:hypothetical protein [Nitrospirota bacterium]